MKRYLVWGSNVYAYKFTLWEYDKELWDVWKNIKTQKEIILCNDILYMGRHVVPHTEYYFTNDLSDELKLEIL